MLSFAPSVVGPFRLSTARWPERPLTDFESGPLIVVATVFATVSVPDTEPAVHRNLPLPTRLPVPDSVARACPDIGLPSMNVVPDAVVERTEAGDYEVKLVDDWVPEVHIPRHVVELAREHVFAIVRIGTAVETLFRPVIEARNPTSRVEKYQRDIQPLLIIICVNRIQETRLIVII